MLCQLDQKRPDAGKGEEEHSSGSTPPPPPLQRGWGLSLLPQRGGRWKCQASLGQNEMLHNEVLLLTYAIGIQTSFWLPL